VRRRIVPITAHAAFDKAAEYFCIKIIHIDILEDGKVDVRKVQQAITNNTIMVGK
jgi:sphinganine-1-phosphate aldolase